MLAWARMQWRRRGGGLCQPGLGYSGGEGRAVLAWAKQSHQMEASVQVHEPLGDTAHSSHHILPEVASVRYLCSCEKSTNIHD